MKLHIEPLTLAEANALVEKWHRHHKRSQGHRFSIGVFDEDRTPHGAAIVGRPVGGRTEGTDQLLIAEVVRLVTDGTPNACSMLYAASARAAKAMGFAWIQTYILAREPGISLRASGWKFIRQSRAIGWDNGNRPRNEVVDGGRPKQLWRLKFGDDTLAVAGIRAKDAKVVDVPAVAQALLASQRTGDSTSLPFPKADSSVLEPRERDTVPCGAFGHPNAPGAAFCVACGLPMTAAPASQGKPELPRPKPEAQLTVQEKEDRDAQHAAAITATAQFEKAPEVIVQTPGEAIVIHFVEDGFTFAGRVWYRGQEMEIGPGHPRWPDASRWIMLTRYEQVERYGKQYFEHGPWPGRRSYTDSRGMYEELNTMDKSGKFAGPTEEQLRQADAAEQARGRGVPAPAFG